MKRIILLTTVFVSCSLISFAQPGVPDSSFGKNGIANVGASAKQVLMQNDGTMYVILGQTLITHILANGTIDTSFGDNGYSQSVPVPDCKGALQSDGKIVVAGGFVNSAVNIFRFNTNGTLDPTLSVKTADFKITSLAIQQDGKIVVVGFTALTSNGYDFAIARYNTDGTPDATFSEDGKQTTDFGLPGDIAQSVAIQSDGKIVVAGYTQNQDHTFADFAIARYNTDGTPDITFSGDGKQTIDFASGQAFAKSVAIQSDGKIVVAGVIYRDIFSSSKLLFALARYNSDGSPDNTFSEDGKQTTEFEVSPGDTPISMDGIIQSDGKIVVAGFYSLARYNTDGSLDSTFSKDGKQVIDFEISSAAIQSDGKLVVAAGVVLRYFLDENKSSITLEAEEALLNGPVVASNHPGFTGSGFADYKNASGDFIEWTVDAEAAGSYSLKFRYANGGSTNRPLELKVNGVVVNASVDFSPTGSWTTWLVSSTTTNLMAGSNKIRLTAIGLSGPNVDHMVVIANTGTLEAEEAILNGAVVSSNNPGFTGSGFADYLNPSGDFIEWTVNASAAGSYSLKFRYANGGTANRPLQLNVNGVTVNATLDFPSTESWTTWSVSSTNSNLIAGINKIRLTAIGLSGPNVDHLAYSYNDVPQLVQRASAKSLLPAFDLLKLNVAPNPANNILNIQATGLQKNKPVIVSVISSSGVIMKTQRSDSYRIANPIAIGSTQTIQLNVSSLASGVYTIKLITGNRVMYKQFVKL